MLKIIAAGIIALVIADVTVSPSFSRIFEATAPQRTAKGDRLDTVSIETACSQAAWPNYDSACVRSHMQSNAAPRNVRIIAIDRLPPKPLALASLN